MTFLNKLFKHETKLQPGSVKDDFIAFLKTCNCTYKVIDEPDNNQTRFFFDYQGGHFIAVVKNTNVGIEVSYPCFLDTPTDELNIARSICNRGNSYNIVFKFTYSFDDEDNRINIHLSFFCNTVVHSQLKELLTACFHMQRNFIDEYRDAKEMTERKPENDLEESYNQLSRERYLVALQEMKHDATSDHQGWRANDTHTLRLGDFIEKALGIRQCVARSLTITRGTEVETVDSDILDWDMSRLLITGHGKNAILSYDHAVALLQFSSVGSDMSPDDITDQTLTITAMPDGSDDKSLYMRVSALISPRAISRTHSLSAKQPALSTAVLMAYDLVTDEQRQQEFDYMWQDARIKIRDGEELSEQQQLIYDVARANIGYNLYWGQSLMLNNRYYEALLHFENAYYDLLPEFYNLDDHLKSTFMRICYNIGFCYNELRQYRDAFYFLHICSNENNVLSATEWINCLANAKDMRVFNAIERCLDSLSEQFKNNDDIPEHIQNFIRFLRRRRAYALIDFNHLDEAEKAFKDLLDDPESSDYALSELAFIERLRNQREQAALPADKADEANKASQNKSNDDDAPT